MITISLSGFFVFLVAVSSITIVVFMFLHRKAGRIIVSNRILFTCPVCAYRYIAESNDKLSRCPQCESINEYKKGKR